MSQPHVGEALPRASPPPLTSPRGERKLRLTSLFSSLRHRSHSVGPSMAPSVVPASPPPPTAPLSPPMGRRRDRRSLIVAALPLAQDDPNRRLLGDSPVLLRHGVLAELKLRVHGSDALEELQPYQVTEHVCEITSRPRTVSLTSPDSIDFRYKNAMLLLFVDYVVVTLSRQPGSLPTDAALFSQDTGASSSATPSSLSSSSTAHNLLPGQLLLPPIPVADIVSLPGSGASNAVGRNAQRRFDILFGDVSLQFTCTSKSDAVSWLSAIDGSRAWRRQFENECSLQDPQLSSRPTEPDFVSKKSTSLSQASNNIEGCSSSPNLPSSSHLGMAGPSLDQQDKDKFMSKLDGAVSSPNIPSDSFNAVSSSSFSSLPPTSASPDVSVEESSSSLLSRRSMSPSSRSRKSLPSVPVMSRFIGAKPALPRTLSASPAVMRQVETSPSLNMSVDSRMTAWDAISTCTSPAQSPPPLSPGVLRRAVLSRNALSPPVSSLPASPPSSPPTFRSRPAKLLPRIPDGTLGGTLGGRRRASDATASLSFLETTTTMHVDDNDDGDDELEVVSRRRSTPDNSNSTIVGGSLASLASAPPALDIGSSLSCPTSSSSNCASMSVSVTATAWSTPSVTSVNHKDHVEDEDEDETGTAAALRGPLQHVPRGDEFDDDNDIDHGLVPASISSPPHPSSSSSNVHPNRARKGSKTALQLLSRSRPTHSYRVAPTLSRDTRPASTSNVYTALSMGSSLSNSLPDVSSGLSSSQEDMLNHESDSGLSSPISASKQLLGSSKCVGDIALGLSPIANTPEDPSSLTPVRRVVSGNCDTPHPRDSNVLSSTKKVAVVHAAKHPDSVRQALFQRPVSVSDLPPALAIPQLTHPKAQNTTARVVTNDIESFPDRFMPSERQSVSAKMNTAVRKVAGISRRGRANSTSSATEAMRTLQAVTHSANSSNKSSVIANVTTITATAPTTTSSSTAFASATGATGVASTSVSVSSLASVSVPVSAPSSTTAPPMSSTSSATSSSSYSTTVSATSPASTPAVGSGAPSASSAATRSTAAPPTLSPQLRRINGSGVPTPSALDCIVPEEDASSEYGDDMGDDDDDDDDDDEHDDEDEDDDEGEVETISAPRHKRTGTLRRFHRLQRAMSGSTASLGQVSARTTQTMVISHAGVDVLIVQKHPKVSNVTIMAGRRDKLVELLASEEPLDDEYVNTMVVMHRAFMSSLTLLDMLVARFCIVPKLLTDPDDIEHYRRWKRPIQTNVMVTLKMWITLCWSDFEEDETLRARLLSFIDQIKAAGYFKAHIEFMRHVQENIRHAHLAASASRGYNMPLSQSTTCLPDVSPSSESSNAMVPPEHAVGVALPPSPDIIVPPPAAFQTAVLSRAQSIHHAELLRKPVCVAEALTEYDSMLYSRIPAREFLAHTWKAFVIQPHELRTATFSFGFESNPPLSTDEHTPVSPMPSTASDTAVNQFIARFDRESYWVATCVCQARGVRARADMLTLFLTAAARCLELNNFFTAVAISVALRMRPIRNMSEAWLCVDESLLKVRQKINGLLDQQHNMRRLRLSMQKAARGERGLIPFLPIFLKDVLFIGDGNKSIVHSSLINLDKLRMATRTIVSLVHFQRSPFQMAHPRPFLHAALRAAEDAALTDLVALCDLASENATNESHS